MPIFLSPSHFDQGKEAEEEEVDLLPLKLIRYVTDQRKSANFLRQVSLHLSRCRYLKETSELNTHIDIKTMTFLSLVRSLSLSHSFFLERITLLCRDQFSSCASLQSILR